MPRQCLRLLLFVAIVLRLRLNPHRATGRQCGARSLSCLNPRLCCQRGA